MNEELLDLFAERLRAASSTRAVRGLLRAINQEQELRPGELRFAGTKEELLQSVRSGCERGLLSTTRLAQLVDRLEENGSQHVFLFDLTEEGRDALTAEALKSTFPLMPPQPTKELYATRPRDSVHLSERPDAIVIKQVYTATYWEQDESRSFSRETERANYQVQRYRRAVNLFRLIPQQKTAEIRIDRVMEHDRNKQAVMERFRTFLLALAPIVNVRDHLLPTPIWHAYRPIVEDRSCTYMNVDETKDASTNLVISNRRAAQAGKDVRDHESYAVTRTEGYTRERLSVYWKTDAIITMPADPERNDRAEIHTVLSRVKLNGRDYGKLYIAATVSPEVLSSVTQRIRRFAGESS